MFLRWLEQQKTAAGENSSELVAQMYRNAVPEDKKYDIVVLDTYTSAQPSHH